MTRDEAVREQATAWAVRTGDPAFGDWDGFTAWLERDPEHARAYDEVMVAVAEAAETVPPSPAELPPAINDDEPGRWTRRRWMGGALAVAVAAMTAFGAWQLRGDSYAIETAPGEVQLVEIDGGGQIAVAGGSRLVLDRADPHRASLEQGQALFTLREDSGAAFSLTVGADTIVDIGTVFDVTHTGAGLRVAVSEGAVVLNPRTQNVRVSPGQSLTKAAGTDAYRISDVALAEVGEWRAGRLTFQDAPLAEVAADLSRATGTAFSVAPRASGQRVSGSFVLDAVREDPRTVGALLGVPIRLDGAQWEIGAR